MVLTGSVVHGGAAAWNGPYHLPALGLATNFVRSRMLATTSSKRRRFLPVYSLIPLSPLFNFGDFTFAKLRANDFYSIPFVKNNSMFVILAITKTNFLSLAPSSPFLWLYLQRNLTHGRSYTQRKKEIIVLPCVVPMLILMNLISFLE